MSREAGVRTKPSGLGAFLFNELRQAFQDIRQKAVEEGWFGRVTTAKPVIEMPFQATDPIPPEEDGLLHERRPSFEELWAPKEPHVERSQDSLDLDR
jgi:hypothetical protein